MMTTPIGPRKSKPTAVIFTAPEGHASLAKAAEAALSQDFSVKTTLIRDEFFNVYIPIYQFFPLAGKVPYLLTTPKPVRKYLKIMGKNKYSPAVAKELVAHKPVLTVCTHFMFLPGLEKAKQEHTIPLLNIVSDPWTIHPLLIGEHASTNLVFDTTAAQNVVNLVPAAVTQPTGWLVQPKFVPAKNQTAIRKKLHLKPNIFTVVFSAGSEGTLAILNFIPTLLQLDTPCQFVVLCGNNKQLAKTIKAIHTGVTKVNSKVAVHAIPYTDKVHEYYAAADLVAGKAGPNTIFEAVACHKPFLALTHIHGQEDGNLELLRHYHLGYVEENIFRAGQLLTKLIRKPELLTKLQPSIQKMADFNQGAAEKLRQTAQKLTES